MTNEPEHCCPCFHHAIELIGRRWSGVILDSMFRGATRFHEIAEAVPALSDKMLTERLRELTGEGLIVREVIPDTPVRVEYRLTEKGRALEGILDDLAAWARAWSDRPA